MVCTLCCTQKRREMTSRGKSKYCIRVVCTLCCTQKRREMTSRGKSKSRIRVICTLWSARESSYWRRKKPRAPSIWVPALGSWFDFPYTFCMNWLSVVRKVQSEWFDFPYTFCMKWLSVGRKIQWDRSEYVSLFICLVILFRTFFVPIGGGRNDSRTVL